MKKLFAFLLAACLLTAPALAAEGPDSRSADPATCAHHFEVSVLREATCSQKGLLAYTCAKCGLTYTAETLPDGEHDYALTASTATCTEPGEATYTCVNCGDSYTEPVPAAGHMASAEAPTCTEPVVCTVCGQLLEQAVGHSYEYMYDAQFDEDGALTSYGTWQCTNCGHVMAATRGNADDAEEDAVPAAEDSGTDLTLIEGESYADDSPTDGGAATEEDGGTDASGQHERAGLWIGVSAAALAVIILETVLLIRSLKKNKTTL